MPAMYAHQCFGDTVYRQLPEEIKRRINPHRDLYSIGLQGPDIFFYEDPIFWGAVPQYGNRLHAQTGHVFFETALRLLWEEHDREGEGAAPAAEEKGTVSAEKGAGKGLRRCEATAVYLMGVICHYALDTVCHKDINEAAAAGGPTHAEQEGDFDRHRIELEGRDPVKEDLSAGIHPSREAAEAIQVIYAEADADTVYKSLKGCVGFQHLVRCKGRLKRSLFYAVIRLIGKEKSLSPHIIRTAPDPNCEQTTRHLDELFEAAIPKAVRMIRCLHACLQEGKNLDECRDFLESPDCDRNFEGKEG